MASTELGSDADAAVIACTEDRRVWMVKGWERHDIGLREMNRRHLLLRREATWFPELTRADLSHGGIVRYWMFRGRLDAQVGAEPQVPHYVIASPRSGHEPPGKPAP